MLVGCVYKPTHTRGWRKRRIELSPISALHADGDDIDDDGDFDPCSIGTLRVCLYSQQFWVKIYLSLFGKNTLNIFFVGLWDFILRLS